MNRYVTVGERDEPQVRENEATTDLWNAARRLREDFGFTMTDVISELVEEERSWEDRDDRA